MNRSFSKILIIIVIAAISAGGILTWQKWSEIMASNPSIILLFPKDGETFIHNGTKTMIRWESTNPPEDSYVNLWRNWGSTENSGGSRIATNLPPTGFFEWTPVINISGKSEVEGVSATADRDFTGFIKVELCKKRGEECHDFNGTLMAYDINDTPFRVNTKTDSPLFVKVVFPNGGEALRAGETYAIKWESLEIPSSEKIQIRYSPKNYPSEMGGLLIAQVVNTGSYNWAIPKSFVADCESKMAKINCSQLKIQISHFNSLDEFTAFDYSDSVFTVNTSPE